MTNNHYTKIINQEFTATIHKWQNKIPSELRKMLLAKTHERVKAYLENLSDEFMKVENLRKRKGKGPPTEKVLRAVVQDMHTNFIGFILRADQDARMSENAKNVIRAKEQEKKDMESTIAGKAAGIYEEMGVVTDEKILGNRDEVLQEKK